MSQNLRQKRKAAELLVLLLVCGQNAMSQSMRVLKYSTPYIPFILKGPYIPFFANGPSSLHNWYMLKPVLPSSHDEPKAVHISIQPVSDIQNSTISFHEHGTLILVEHVVFVQNSGKQTSNDVQPSDTFLIKTKDDQYLYGDGVEVLFKHEKSFSNLDMKEDNFAKNEYLWKYRYNRVLKGKGELVHVESGCKVSFRKEVLTGFYQLRLCGPIESNRNGAFFANITCSEDEYGPWCEQKVKCNKEKGFCAQNLCYDKNGTGHCSSCSMSYRNKTAHFDFSLDNTCNKCKPNWDPKSNCTQCLSGYFGKNCDRPISCRTETGFCGEDSCFGVNGNGSCTHCQFPLYDRSSKYYGTLCRRRVKCNENFGICPENECNGVTGDGMCSRCRNIYEDKVIHFDFEVDKKCTTCKKNWDFRKNCTECLPGFFGKNCSEKIFCNEVGGVCMPGSCYGVKGDGKCTYCRKSFFGESCQMQTQCDPINGLCDEGTCFGKYAEGFCSQCQSSNNYGLYCNKKVSCNRQFGICTKKSCYGRNGTGLCNSCISYYKGKSTHFSYMNSSCEQCTGNFDIASGCTECRSGYTGGDCSLHSNTSSSPISQAHQLHSEWFHNKYIQTTLIPICFILLICVILSRKRLKKKQKLTSESRMDSGDEIIDGYSGESFNKSKSVTLPTEANLNQTALCNQQTYSSTSNSESYMSESDTDDGFNFTYTAAV